MLSQPSEIRNEEDVAGTGISAGTSNANFRAP